MPACVVPIYGRMSETTKPPSSADVDAYLAKLPNGQRTALQALRDTIRAVVPEAQETISYQVPTFKYRRRPLVAVGAATQCSF